MSAVRLLSAAHGCVFVVRTPYPRLEHDTSAFVNALVLMPVSIEIDKIGTCTRYQPVGNK